MNKKKVLGFLYPIFIGLFVLAIYYTMIVNLVFMNLDNLFATKAGKWATIAYLAVFHTLLALIVYCYFYMLFSNPGEPPQFWVS